jgi:hypothetical protein
VKYFVVVENKANVCVHSIHPKALDLLVELVPAFSVHPDELAESTKVTLNNRAYFYANSNAGLGWTDKANRYVHCALILAGFYLTFF